MIAAATAFEEWHKQVFGYNSDGNDTNELRIRAHAYLSGFAAAKRQIKAREGGTIPVPECLHHSRRGACVSCFVAGYRAAQKAMEYGAATEP